VNEKRVRPFVIGPLGQAGLCQRTIETGRVLDYVGQPDDDRKLCSLYLSIMERMGVKAGRFGDAEAGLAGL